MIKNTFFIRTLFFLSSILTGGCVSTSMSLSVLEDQCDFSKNYLDAHYREVDPWVIPDSVAVLKCRTEELKIKNPCRHQMLCQRGFEHELRRLGCQDQPYTKLCQTLKEVFQLYMQASWQPTP